MTQGHTWSESALELVFVAESGLEAPATSVTVSLVACNFGLYWISLRPPDTGGPLRPQALRLYMAFRPVTGGMRDFVELIALCQRLSKVAAPADTSTLRAGRAGRASERVQCV